ncbi:MAG: bestrophin family ion channel [Cyanobacteriota bacterium]
MSTNKRTLGSQVKGSVLPAVLKRVILCGLFGILISSIQNLRTLGISVSLPFLGGLIPTLIIGFLFVARTNTAYERFGEGRKSWGNLIDAGQNLARHIWAAVREHEPHHRSEKLAVMRLVVAFPLAAKSYLRQEPVNTELTELMSTERYLELKQVANPPLQIAFWIEEYLQEQYQHKCITNYQLSVMHKLLDTMTESLGACDRIIKTPMPLAQVISMRTLLLVYCLSLAFQLVDYFRLFTGFIVAFLSFIVLGLEEINSEIENPFGYDYNDLPLDASCDMMLENIQDLMSNEPSLMNRQFTAFNGNQEPQFVEK